MQQKLVNSHKEAFGSWVCSNTSVQDLNANLSSIQNTDIYNHISTLTDKNVKEAMKYAYSNQTVNSTVNETLTSQSLEAVINALNELNQNQVVNFVATDSSNITNVNITLDATLAQSITSDYANFCSTKALAAIETVNNRASANSTDTSQGTSAETDNSASAASDAHAANDQSGGQSSDNKQSFRRRVIGTPYFPKISLIQKATLPRSKKESCGLLTFVDADTAVTNENMNIENQQITNIDQQITQEVYEDYDISQNFDIAMSAIVESVNRTKNENLSSSSVELINKANQNNEVNINFSGSHDISGITIDLSASGVQSINSFTIIGNILTSSMNAIQKGMILDILGLVAHQDVDSSTSSDADASSSSSMENTQEMDQKATTKTTNTVAIIIIVIIIIAVLLIMVFSSRDKDPVFNPHGGKNETSDYSDSDIASTPVETVDNVIESGEIKV